MPKKTFSDADIIRIWCDHLDLKEQVITLFVFAFILPEILTERAIGSISITIGRLFQWLKRGIFGRLIRATVLRVLQNFLDDKVIKAIDDCYKTAIKNV